MEFFPASEYEGLGNYRTMAQLWKRFGRGVGVMSIGQAGEKRLTAASINFTDPHGRPGRAAGRGGLGALMGSKKLKALVVDDKGAPAGVPLADPEKFKAAARKWAKFLIEHPVSGQALPAFGTAVLINIVNEAGALPTKNFRGGRFEFAEDISGERMVELIKARGGKTKEGCHPGCLIQCSQTYHDAKGKYLTSGFEYETIWALGANTLIKNLDEIAMIDRLCDDFGLDTIEMGCTLGVLMEGGAIPWGDGPAAIKMMKKVAKNDPWGLIIGNGSVFAGRALGVDRVPAVKGQGLPAYDPRAEKGMGLTYATSPMGGDHTAGYTVATNLLKCGGDGDPSEEGGQYRALPQPADRHRGHRLHRPLPVRGLPGAGQPRGPAVHRGHDQRPLRPEPDHRRRGHPGPPGAARRTELQPRRRLHQGPRPPAGLLQGKPEAP